MAEARTASERKSDRRTEGIPTELQIRHEAQGHPRVPNTLDQEIQKPLNPKALKNPKAPKETSLAQEFRSRAG